MRKLLLLQMIMMAIVIPVQMAKDPNPRRGFKRTLFFYQIFCFVYVFALIFFYFRLG
jgi:hypothetical protein